MKLLGIDPGSKRVGISIYDPISALCRIEPVLERQVLKKDLEFFVALCQRESIEGIVLGHPTSLAGKTTDSTLQAEFWAKTLSEHLKLPLWLQDEALSTTEAELRLKHLPPEKRRRLRDSMSASVILEEFLSSYDVTKPPYR